MTDVYCSAKFTQLHFNVQHRLLHNCIDAYPEKINLKWLQENPEKLLLTPKMIEDRKMMLEGKKCESCSWGCYDLESKGTMSKRTRNSPHPVHTDIYKLPEAVSINLTNDCNLTCVYCGPGVSTSWVRDLQKNGNYKDNPLRTLLPEHEAALKVKQRSRGVDSTFFKILVDQIRRTKSIKRIGIYGGEPLLNDGIYDIIESNQDKKISITTGLGISGNRFSKFLSVLGDNRNISLSLSAESTGKFFEFIRFGCDWKKFSQMINELEKNQISFSFNPVICNLALFDFFNFYDEFNHHKINYSNVHLNTYLNAGMLDPESKAAILEKITKYKIIDKDFFEKVEKDVKTSYDDKERLYLKYYLLEFSKRRGLDHTIYPKSFLSWLGLK